MTRIKNTDTDFMARHMLESIANRYIQCQNKWEGMDEQRRCFLKAKEFIKIMEKEYREWCKK